MDSPEHLSEKEYAMNDTGKKARKSGGNRHQLKKSKKGQGMTSKYSEKRARWADEEKDRKRHEKQG